MWGAIISAVGSIATSAIGAGLSAKAGKEAVSQLRQGYNSAKDWYNRLYNQDYINRSEVQGVLTQVREQMNDRYKRARATNIVAGGTDESLALQQMADNKAIADATSSVASNASIYKDKVGQAIASNDKSFANAMSNAYNQKGKNVADAVTSSQSAWEGIAKIDA